jgi:hypothetical protein
MKSLSITLLLLLLPVAGLTQEIHPDVQAAIDWQLPENDCKPPSLKQSHVTTGQERKLERATRKYEKCMSEYRAILAEDQQKMMDSAAHGLTQSQADTIMGHIKIIQKVMEPVTVPPVSAMELDDPSVFLVPSEGTNPDGPAVNNPASELPKSTNRTWENHGTL